MRVYNHFIENEQSDFIDSRQAQSEYVFQKYVTCLNLPQETYFLLITCY